MNYAEFVRRVESCSPGRPTQSDAERAIRATLAALAARVSAKEARDLAAQLPVELKRPLLDGAGPAQRFGFGEFLRRVADREGMSPSEALHHSRAVIHVMTSAVTAAELDDVRAELPEDFEPLFRPIAAAE